LIVIVLYYLLIIILFMSFSNPVHLHDSIIVWLHDICICTFPFILHTHWEVWLHGFAHPGSCIFYIADQVFGEDHPPYEELEFPYLVIPSQYIVTLFYSYRSFWFLHWTFVLFFYSYAIIVLHIYMSYCSDIDLS